MEIEDIFPLRSSSPHWGNLRRNSHHHGNVLLLLESLLNTANHEFCSFYRIILANTDQVKVNAIRDSDQLRLSVLGYIKLIIIVSIATVFVYIPRSFMRITSAFT